MKRNDELQEERTARIRISPVIAQFLRVIGKGDIDRGVALVLAADRSEQLRKAGKKPEMAGSRMNPPASVELKNEERDFWGL